MNDKEELIKVGKYNLEFNDILGINIDELEIFRSKGLPSHMVKRKHFKCLKYIDYIPDIILDHNQDNRYLLELSMFLSREEHLVLVIFDTISLILGKRKTITPKDDGK